MSLVSVAPELVVTAVPDVARIGSSIGADVVALFGWVAR